MSTEHDNDDFEASEDGEFEEEELDDTDLDDADLDLDEVDLDEDLETDLEEDLEGDLEEEITAEDFPVGDYEDEEDEGEDEEEDEETAEALDELEAEELELLDEEVEDALLVDEAAELRAIRREELTLNVDAQAPRSDEFVCRSCFLVKRSSQLANKRKMICRDCAE